MASDLLKTVPKNMFLKGNLFFFFFFTKGTNIYLIILYILPYRGDAIDIGSILIFDQFQIMLREEQLLRLRIKQFNKKKNLRQSQRCKTKF